MIRLIFKQLWNQRRQNGWIFLELLVVCFFLWNIIDPVYVQFANMSIDPGNDTQNTYKIQLGYYTKNNHNFKKTCDSDSAMTEDFIRIVKQIKNTPEVESFVIMNESSHPYARATQTSSYYKNDSLYVNAQVYNTSTVEGSDFFRTFRLRDAYTGEIIRQEDITTDNIIYISKNIADALSPSENMIGKTIQSYSESEFRVGGIFQNYIARPANQPIPTVIHLSPTVTGKELCFRIRDGVDAEKFEKMFKKQIAPTIKYGNFYYINLQRFSDLREQIKASTGVSNQLRLQYALTVFSLLCVFLGIVGTFWIRCNARRQEIGLMCSLGCTRKRIRWQFLCEGWLLMTIAFILVIPFQIHWIHENGFASPTHDGSMEYLQNQPVAHFLIVTVISYLLLLVITLIGTYIPTSQAAKTVPAEALRDE